MQNPTIAHYTPAGGGRILFVRDNNLYSQRLNLKQCKLEGDAEWLQETVATAGLAIPEFSVSRSGLVAWRPGRETASQVTVFDRLGRKLGTFGPPNRFSYLRLSPDETHLLAKSEDGVPQLLERDRTGLSSLGPVEWTTWSSDSTHVAGVRGSQVVERSVSGTGEIRALANASRIDRLEDISPDGKVALYSVVTGGDRSVFSVRLDRPGDRPNSIVDTGEQILNVRFSPDGRWIIYNARARGGDRLGNFVQPFPGPGLRRQISCSGMFPVWRQDGKEVVFLERNSKQILSVPVTFVAGEPHFGVATPLFGEPPALDLLAAFNPIEVTRDGSQILFPQALPQPEDPNVIHIKSGWLETPH
jgi:WD40-like Beta Propeller Repeat